MFENFIINGMFNAFAVSAKSTAKKRQVGCVITNGFYSVTGYNSVPECYKSNGFENNENKTFEYVQHAEQNTIFSLHKFLTETNEGIDLCINEKNKKTVFNKNIKHLNHSLMSQFIMFITHSPCMNCSKLIVASGIKNVYIGELDKEDFYGSEKLIQEQSPYQYLKDNNINIYSVSIINNTITKL